VLDVVIKFVWERPVKGKGFTWEEDGEDPNRSRLARVEGAPFEQYQPLTVCTGLFRTFAELQPTPTAILTFANRYGAPGDDNAGGLWDFCIWKEMIGRMQFLVGAWDALSQGDWKRMRSGLAKMPRSLFQQGIDLGNANQAQLVGAVIHLLYHEVAGMTFGWTFGVWARQQNSPVLWNQQTKRPLLKLVPPSLWHAMYLQFAQAILGSKRYQRCGACNRWFELAPGINRSDRRICSDSCRVQLYRIRQQRARELHARGRTIKQISKELGSDVATIETWINKRKG
jgi:hypothetical protein